MYGGTPQECRPIQAESTCFQGVLSTKTNVHQWICGCNFTSAQLITPTGKQPASLFGSFKEPEFAQPPKIGRTPARWKEGGRDGARTGARAQGCREDVSDVALCRCRHVAVQPRAAASACVRRARACCSEATSRAGRAGRRRGAGGGGSGRRRSAPGDAARKEGGTGRARWDRGRRAGWPQITSQPCIAARVFYGLYFSDAARARAEPAGVRGRA